MRKIVLAIGVIIGLASCGGYSDEQGKAAETLCECMENDPYGDFDINFYECDILLKESFAPEVFEEGSWIEALEEKCSNVAEMIGEE